MTQWPVWSKDGIGFVPQFPGAFMECQAPRSFGCFSALPGLPIPLGPSARPALPWSLEFAWGSFPLQVGLAAHWGSFPLQFWNMCYSQGRCFSPSTGHCGDLSGLFMASAFCALQLWLVLAGGATFSCTRRTESLAWRPPVSRLLSFLLVPDLFPALTRCGECVTCLQTCISYVYSFRSWTPTRPVLLFTCLHSKS